MSWCWKCTKEDPNECPYFNIFKDCTYGGGCYLEEQKENNECEDLRTGQ